MRVVMAVIVVAAMLTVQSRAQLKMDAEAQSSVAHSLVRPTTNIGNFLGLLNPDNFLMRHNFSLSYMTAGDGGLSIASYTNSMFYKIADPLNIRFDVTLQGSPFGSDALVRQNDLNKVFISRAELNYRPWENFLVYLQYRQSPSIYRTWDDPYSLYHFLQESDKAH